MSTIAPTPKPEFGVISVQPRNSGLERTLGLESLLSISIVNSVHLYQNQRNSFSQLLDIIEQTEA